MKAPGKNAAVRNAYLGALAAASLAIGCGGGDDDGSNNADRYEGDDRDVAAVVDELADAGRDGDGARICEQLFAETLVRTVERDSEQSCATEVADNLPEDEYELKVDSVEVAGDKATAAVTEQDGRKSVLHLVKNGGEWRIVRVSPRL